MGQGLVISSVLSERHLKSCLEPPDMLHEEIN